MTTRSWSGRVARRASAVGAAMVLGLVGTVAVAPTAPATPAATTGNSAVAVTVGASHSCGLTAVGGVRCWGRNPAGQLGDGTVTDRPRPVDVVGLTSGVAQVSAGTSTTCAVTTAGGVKCWGDGSIGELGNGIYGTSSTPVDVVGLTTGVASVSVGHEDVCAVTVTGAAKCWGHGFHGALGNGGVAHSPVPVDVVGLGSGVEAVSTGYYGACALTAAGVSCWGDNSTGQLGNDSVGRYQTTPVPVVGLGADVTSISSGLRSTCAATSSGRVSCWGLNGPGYLGVGSLQNVVRTPRPVRGLSGVSAVSDGSGTSCAAQTHRTVCWGYNVFGSVGDGTTTDRTTPVQVVGLPGPSLVVAAGYDHSCAVTGAGRVFCWGANSYGQLGNGSRAASLTPVRVSGLGA